MALRFRELALTYRELDLRSNRLAHRLRRLGVGPDYPVAICMERSLELVVAILGVLKAGGAYVPLDPDYPAQRIAYMVNDAAPQVILCQDSLVDRLPEHAAQVVCLNAEDPIDALPDSLPEVSVDPRNLAYVIYTSGSTGQPKGVMVDHAGLTNRLLWMQDEYRLTPSDRLMQKTPFSFDVSVWEFLWPLMVGATWSWPSQAVTPIPRYIAEPGRAGVDHDHPFRPLDAGGLPRGTGPGAPLRQPARGSTAAARRSAAQLRNRFLGRIQAELHNEYGPTETGEITVFYCETAEGPLSIGRPIANTTAHVVDRWMQPVPVGVPGELMLGGVALARGYHRQPALTADRYVPNPFDTAGGSRLYRTGDLCRWLPDGSLDYLGRVDHQVKIRGFRIEPAEIESALLTHPAVRQAVVLVRGDVPGDPRLVAYLITDGREPAAAELRSHLTSLLPQYMVPAAFVRLESLPLTSSGKLDRRALPAPVLPAREETALDLPRTPTEERLAAIWREVLGLERVGIHDNFFELGGHSLLATRVVARTREAVGADLPLRAMFEQPTVAGIAARLEAGKREAAIPALANRAGPQPLSYAQWRVWFLDRLVPGSAAYSIVDARLLSGPLDVPALSRALTEVVRRHQALRSPIISTSGSPQQMVVEPGEVELSVTGLARSELAQVLRDEAARPIPMDSGQLLRARLWRLDEQEHAFSLAVHHCAFDEWSLDVLHSELSALYGAFTRGEPSPLPELDLQYADFAAWQRRQLESGDLQPQLDYWLSQLADAPELLELPTDHPRPAVQTYTGGRFGFGIQPELASELKELAGRHDVTLFMTYLAAFQALLHRISRAADRPGRHPHRRSLARRTRAAARALCEHAGDAGRLRLGPELQRATGPSKRAGAGCLLQPGPALRAAGRGAGTVAGGQPQPGLPGHVRVPERRRRPADAGGTERFPARSRERDLQVRPDAGRVRHGLGRAAGRVRVQQRPVRAGDGRADGRPVPALAGRRGQRPFPHRSASWICCPRRRLRASVSGAGAPRRRPSSSQYTRPWRTGRAALRRRRPCAGTAAS